MQVKHTTKRFFILLGFFAFLGITACEKEKDQDNNQTVETKPGLTYSASGKLTLNFSHYFKDATLKFSPDSFVTAAGDTIFISDLKYFVSNVTFVKADGSSWNAGNFALLKANDLSPVTIQGIPAGNYTQVTFLLGVDSANNHTLNHSEPALDPGTGMSWGWNTGYIFYRLTGYHGAAKKGFSFDIGGDAHLLKITFDLSGYKISGTEAQATVKVDVNKFFENPNTYDLKTQVTDIHDPSVPAISLLTANIANGMFKLGGIQ